MPWPAASSASQQQADNSDDKQCGICGNVVDEEEYITGTCSLCGQSSYHQDCVEEWLNTKFRSMVNRKNLMTHAKKRTAACFQLYGDKCPGNSWRGEDGPTCAGRVVSAEEVKPQKVIVPAVMPPRVPKSVAQKQAQARPSLAGGATRRAPKLSPVAYTGSIRVVSAAAGSGSTSSSSAAPDLSRDRLGVKLPSAAGKHKAAQELPPGFVDERQIQRAKKEAAVQAKAQWAQAGLSRAASSHASEEGQEGGAAGPATEGHVLQMDFNPWQVPGAPSVAGSNPWQVPGAPSGTGSEAGATAGSSAAGLSRPASRGSKDDVWQALVAAARAGFPTASGAPSAAAASGVSSPLSEEEDQEQGSDASASSSWVVPGSSEEPAVALGKEDPFVLPPEPSPAPLEASVPVPAPVPRPLPVPQPSMPEAPGCQHPDDSYPATSTAHAAASSAGPDAFSLGYQAGIQAMLAQQAAAVPAAASTAQPAFAWQAPQPALGVWHTTAAPPDPERSAVDWGMLLGGDSSTASAGQGWGAAEHHGSSPRLGEPELEDMLALLCT